MDRKIITIVLALALISCFFLPYLKYGAISANGFHLLTDKTTSGADKGLLLIKYIWVLIPVAAVMLLAGALNKGNYFLGRGIWALLPLLTVLLLVAQLFRDAKKIKSGISISDLSENFGIGFWITLGIALVLAFYWPGKKK
jgi:hypothetical protein